MIDDGLYQPLGQGSAKQSGWPAWMIPVGLALLGACAVAAWIWVHRDSRPAAVNLAATPAPQTTPLVAREQPPSVVPAAIPPASPPAPPTPPAAMSNLDTEVQNGVTVVRPPGSGAATGRFVAVPQADPLALPPAPDPRLIEKGRYGPLPRRGADGSRPAEVYGRPLAVDAAQAAGTPRIALFVGGMGLNRALTAEAARSLPPAVTLGFAPYGGDLEQQAAQARALGHEAVLQVPMESFNTPDGSQMPHMLAVADGPRETLDNLHWQMSRFVGYAGVAGFLGGKFTGDATAFRPVMKEVADRGLFYFDDGTSARTIAATLGAEVNAPSLRADVAIDALADPAKVDEALKRLESIARSKGVAVGSTTGLPTVVDHLAAFTRDLATRGVTLVPVSSVALSAKPTAAP